MCCSLRIAQPKQHAGTEWTWQPKTYMKPKRAKEKNLSTPVYYKQADLIKYEVLFLMVVPAPM